MRGVSEVHRAFSRGGGPKRYVQDALQEPALAARLRGVLAHAKAAVFVCGDAGMAVGVVAALRGVVGEAAVARMVEEGRYHEDVFGLIAREAGGKS